MNTQAIIIKATSKGQVTLPMKWRNQFNTNQFILTRRENSLIIEPLLLESLQMNSKNKTRNKKIKHILKKENQKGAYISVFNGERDNDGQGVELKSLLENLAEIDG